MTGIRPIRLLLLCGSLRSGSVNEAVLRTAAEVVGEGVEATAYAAMGQLPHFNPDDDLPGAELPPAVVALREQLAAADALLVCTPEYAGGLPGVFKNLLDWTVGGGETYGKPVGWVNASSAPTGAADAHLSLRTVLGKTGAHIVEAACRSVPVPRTAVAGGVVTDPALRRGIAAAVTTLADTVAATRAVSG